MCVLISTYILTYIHSSYIHTYIIGKHAAAIFEQFGYSSADGQTVFDTLHYALHKSADDVSDHTNYYQQQDSEDNSSGINNGTNDSSTASGKVHTDILDGKLSSHLTNIPDPPPPLKGMYVCMYVCIYVCMYECVYVYMYV